MTCATTSHQRLFVRAQPAPNARPMIAVRRIPTIPWYAWPRPKRTDDSRTAASGPTQRRKQSDQIPTVDKLLEDAADDADQREQRRNQQAARQASAFSYMGSSALVDQMRAEGRFAAGSHIGLALLQLRLGKLGHPETATKREVLQDGSGLALLEELACERHVRTE